MYLYGASGHGKVIKEVLESQNIVVDGFIDDNPKISTLLGLPVKHTTEDVDTILISIGDNKTRKVIAEQLKCNFANPAIHSVSTISKSAKIGIGTVVMAGVVVNAESIIGEHCIVNTGASIDHDCHIDNYVHISPHATLCGNVTVGEGTWIGAGAVIIQGVCIGRWCIIGAGSVITKDIPDNYLAVGNRNKLQKRIIKKS